MLKNAYLLVGLWWIIVGLVMGIVALNYNRNQTCFSAYWQDLSPYRFEDGEIGWTYQATLPPSKELYSLTIAVPSELRISSVFLRDTREPYWHPHTVQYDENAPNLYRYVVDGTATFNPHSAEVICRNLIPTRRYAVVALLRKD